MPTGQKLVDCTVGRLSTPFICTVLHALHQSARQTESPPTSSTATTTNNTDVFERLIHSFLLLGVLVAGSCPCSIVLTGPLSKALFLTEPSSDCCLHSIYVSSHSSPTKKLFCSDINITNDSPHNVRFVLGASLFSWSLCLWWLGSVTMKSIPSVRSALLPFRACRCLAGQEPQSQSSPWSSSQYCLQPKMLPSV